MTNEIEVEAPNSLFREEEVPSNVEPEYDNNSNNNESVTHYKKWYSRTTGKVSIAFLGTFAVFLAIHFSINHFVPRGFFHGGTVVPKGLHRIPAK